MSHDSTELFTIRLLNNKPERAVNHSSQNYNILRDNNYNYKYNYHHNVLIYMY